ncbi:MAG: Methionyl-tRNA formyltransferase [uncultured Chloroflexia bacterium]|uniref:Methionyl-tRNA formyltransferase n=1 Tax=uncultured Chloroflexia bacterium TaxID=1672391 RepID=A0A6J4I351_9CHLR|nr:MAG: Methionyl-tRNA formyltransferase [uncultured Chloroflexia bacterium]
MRVVFLGTPAFVVQPLRRLVEAGHEIVAVVTQPDRPAGRARAPQPPPVKQAALDLGLPVVQPETLRDPAAVEQLRALRPEVGVVAAYGEILRRNVLEIPTLGYLNIHPSLLPLYRGPSPVAAAILAGDAVTGVTVMLLERAMDAGPILAQASLPLDQEARTGPLTGQLFAMGANLLVGALPLYAAGELVPEPQDHARATITHMLVKDDGRLDWSEPAAKLERAVRAYDPWPGAWTTFLDQPLKIIRATVEAGAVEAAPGTILDTPSLLVATGDGLLRLDEVQPAGKRPMAGSDWRRGQRNAVRLG